MNYVKFQDKELSQLGFGAMRFPMTKPNGPIDEEKALEMVKYAYENGVNYFDTAFFYHNGDSEAFIGKALARFPRDTWYLASKFPGNIIEIVDGKIKVDGSLIKDSTRTYESAADIFEHQLEKCGVEYFDFYLLHNLAEFTYDLYTDEKIGIVEYLLEQKKLGRIKHFGFSMHCNYDTLKKFLEKYDCFEFAQVQINYLDWTLQKASKKHELLTKHGLPIVVMEPVRGGKLAKPGKESVEMLKAARPDLSPAAWALRYVQSLPNIAVILSGMSTMEQVAENIETCSKNDPLTKADYAILNQIVESMRDFVPCTACRYCCNTCPRMLDIPMLIMAYNEAMLEYSWYVRDIIGALEEHEKPAACIKCGACNPHCPQGIDIPDIMVKFADMIEKKQEEK